ncbi:hypothetical protein CYMTET_30583, partial [Cymbomonas tetramitiformis]
VQGLSGQPGVAFLHVTACVAHRNFAGGSGGFLFGLGVQALAMLGSRLTELSAMDSGGALRLESVAEVSLEDVVMANCSAGTMQAKDGGGALSGVGLEQLTMRSVSFRHNSALTAGAVQLEDAATVALTNISVWDTVGGGAVWVSAVSRSVKLQGPDPVGRVHGAQAGPLQQASPQASSGRASAGGIPEPEVSPVASSSLSTGGRGGGGEGGVRGAPHELDERRGSPAEPYASTAIQQGGDIRCGGALSLTANSTAGATLEAEINRTLFALNIGHSRGGGICLVGAAAAAIHHSEFANNHVLGTDGECAFFNMQSVISCTGNPSLGGAVHIAGAAAALSLLDVALRENWAYLGGALSVQDRGNLHIVRCNFSANRAAVGPAIYSAVPQANIQLLDSAFHRNQARPQPPGSPHIALKPPPTASLKPPPPPPNAPHHRPLKPLRFSAGA